MSLRVHRISGYSSVLMPSTPLPDSSPPACELSQHKVGGGSDADIVYGVSKASTYGRLQSAPTAK